MSLDYLRIDGQSNKERKEGLAALEKELKEYEAGLSTTKSELEKNKVALASTTKKLDALNEKIAEGQAEDAAKAEEANAEAKAEEARKKREARFASSKPTVANISACAMDAFIS